LEEIHSHLLISNLVSSFNLRVFQFQENGNSILSELGSLHFLTEVLDCLKSSLALNLPLNSSHRCCQNQWNCWLNLLHWFCLLIWHLSWVVLWFWALKHCPQVQSHRCRLIHFEKERVLLSSFILVLLSLIPCSEEFLFHLDLKSQRHFEVISRLLQELLSRRIVMLQITPCWEVTSSPFWA